MFPDYVQWKTELSNAEQHVLDGERHVARQYEIIAELKVQGHSIELAERLLENFQGLLQIHRDHLARIIASPHLDPP
jgi:hypothetical protein